MNVSIYLNFWKYTERLSVKTSFFCCTMKEKRGGSLQRLIKANLSLHKLPSLDWNKTQCVSERISKQMNEVVLFPADQVVWLSAVALGTKGLPSHCHHSWKPTFSRGAKEKEAEHRHCSSGREWHCDTISLPATQRINGSDCNDISKEGAPPFLLPLQRTRDLQCDFITEGVFESKQWKKVHCLENNVLSSTICCTAAHGGCVQSHTC